VRSGPGVKYGILAKVTNGTALSVLGMAADRVWYRVEGEFGTGWVNNQFTLFRGSIENVPIVRDEIEGALATPLLIVNTAHLNVRRGPGAHYAVLTTVSGGTELPVEGLARDRVWYRVTTTEDSGWVNVNFTLRRGDFRNVLIIEPITAVAVSEAATSDVIDEEPVTLIERPRLIVNTGFLNIRSGPGAYYTVVGTVPGGTELTILGQSPDRVWYQVEGDFGLGWANSQFGIFRGNWSAMPIVPTPG
jgi:uncharacterized protein YgiM (DUF1202 family)